MKILVKFTNMEIGVGMAMEEVHNNLILGNKKVDAIVGILVQRVASTNLHQLDRTNKLSVDIVETLRTLNRVFEDEE